jgi:hypothetical protein
MDPSISAAQNLATRATNNTQPGLALDQPRFVEAIACEACGTMNRNDAACDCTLSEADRATAEMIRLFQRPALVEGFRAIGPVVARFLHGTAQDVLGRLELFEDSGAELLVMMTAIQLDSRVTVTRPIRARLVAVFSDSDPVATVDG